MTTTAATTSASPSTSNDSPVRDIDISISEPPTTIEQQQQQPQLNHNEQKPQLQPQQQQPQPQPNHALSFSSSRSSTSSSSSSSAASTPPSPPTAQQQLSSSAPQNEQQQQQRQQSQQQSSKQPQQANNGQKRPMNSFLMFCKRQRSLAREKNPNLENRGITKILGDWWKNMDKEQKIKYKELARQHKEAFLKAHPGYKYCKTPVSNDCFNSTTKTSSLSTTTTTSSSSTATTIASATANIHNNHHHNHHRLIPTTEPRQLEAPKPPKKRFLERNDSIHTTKNNSIANSHDKDNAVPYISLDQDTLDRVIDEAFSEKSSDSPSGTNMCKCSNRISTNLTSTIGVHPTPFSSSTSYSITTTTPLTSAPAYADEPVDFSMNRTINATRQQIINNLVEKMLSGPADNASGSSKMNGTDSVQIHSGTSGEER